MKRVNVFGYRVSQDDFERLLYFFTEYYKKKRGVRAHTRARVLLYKVLYTITIKHQKGGGETYSIWRNAPDDIFDRLKVLQVKLDQLLNDFEEPILAKIDKILRSAERGVWEVDLETGRLLTFVPQAQQIYVNVDEEELKDVGYEAEIEEKKPKRGGQRKPIYAPKIRDLIKSISSLNHSKPFFFLMPNLTQQPMDPILERKEERIQSQY